MKKKIKEANLGKQDKESMQDDACYDDGACPEDFTMEEYIKIVTTPHFKVNEAYLRSLFTKNNLSNDEK